MSLPKQISPNPLLNSAVELRFTAEILRDQLLSKVFPHFSSELPKLVDNYIPQEVRGSDENLKFAPEYILSNDKFKMSFGTNMVSFENVGEYQLWGNYFEFIKRQLTKFSGLGIANSVQRIGVRYASIFQDVANPMQILKVYPTLNNGLDGFKHEQLNSFSATYSSDPAAILFLQIYPKVTAIRNNEQMAGFLVDIDSYNTSSFNSIDNSVFDIIDKLHSKEKEFFFKDLLSSEFIKTLNPIY